jgi:hypothetical protein
MNPNELEELLIHIIRAPTVYAEARLHMEAEDWDPTMERHYRILVTELFKLGDSRLYPVGEIPYVAVHTEVRRVLDDDPMLKTAKYQVNDIVGRPTDPDPYNGLLYHAYKVVEESDLSAQYGLTLLKKFLRERQVLDRVRRVIDGAGGYNPAGFEAVLAKVQETAAAIETVGHTGAASMADDLEGLFAWLEASQGKTLLGLATGLDDLDQHMLGLRGLVVLGAMPGSGKTSLAVQIAAGVARRYLGNDAAVLIISLEMDPVAIKARILSHLAELDWAVLRQGSPECRDRPAGPYLNPTHDAKLEAARAELAGEVGRRIRVLGRQDLPGDLNAPRLAALLAKAKAAAGASRALLILDYLQLIEPPAAVQKQGDLAGDKYRIAIMQDIVARTRSPANPEGDAVLAISEVRKPPDAKQGWGAQLADLMGAARTAYVADAVLLYRRMTTAEVKRTYGLGAATKDAVAQHLAQLNEAGVAPMIVSLAKGRDGMTRAEWPMEFLYRRSTWRRPPLILAPVATGGMLAGADDDDDDDGDGDNTNTGPGWPPVQPPTPPSPHGSAASQNGPSSLGQQNGPLVPQNGGLGAMTVPQAAHESPNGQEGQAARARILAALAAAPDGETATALAQAAKLAIGPARAILEGLVAEGRAVAVPVTKPHGKGGKGAKAHAGYRLAGVNDEPAGASPAITQTAVPAISQTITQTKPATPAADPG